MTYQHTQKAPLFGIVLVGIAFFGGLSVFAAVSMDVGRAILFGIVPTMGILLILCGRTAIIREEQEALFVATRCGSVPLSRRRIPYAAITAVEAGTTTFVTGRTSRLFGGGFQYVTGHGWTYTSGPFECVVVHLKDRRQWIIMDDVAGLVAFLKTKIEDRPVKAE